MLPGAMWAWMRTVSLVRRIDERGQDAIEYLVIAGVMALVAIVGIAIFADEIQDWFVAAGMWFRGAPPPPGP
jgi:Flp pilus assembly pilin Flp